MKRHTNKIISLTKQQWQQHYRSVMPSWNRKSQFISFGSMAASTLVKESTTLLSHCSEYKNFHSNVKTGVEESSSSSLQNKSFIKLGVLFAWSGMHERMQRKFEEKTEEILNSVVFPNYNIDKQTILSMTKQNKPSVEKLKQIYQDCNVLLVCPLTGGTEELLQDLVSLKKPIVLYGESYHNSIAASLELRQYFRNYMIPSVLVNKTDLIHSKLEEFATRYEQSWKHFLDLRLGLIGEISPWLINEKDFVTKESLQENGGLEVVTPSFRLPFTKISSKELYDTFKDVTVDEAKEVAILVQELQEQKVKSVCCGGRKKDTTHSEDTHCHGSTGTCGSSNSGSCKSSDGDHSCSGETVLSKVSTESLPVVPTDSLIEACKVYIAIQRLLNKYKLDGFTIGCFDLIADIKTTPCLALGLLNGIPQLKLSDGKLLTMKASACEGELNSLLAMILCQKFLNKSPFMANIVDFTPSQNGMEDELLIAHCTAPMIPGLPFELTTHFESGTGVAVRVDMPTVTGLKNVKSGHMNGKTVAALGASSAMATLIKIKNTRDVIIAPVVVYDKETSLLRCRTQLRLRMQRVNDFVDSTFGNHHLLIYDNYYNVKDMFTELGFSITEHM
ncbi:hypothetical protein C9374_007319 [Naegleria lovaniensis]|uniref:Uncharacterized protein n=1 Tax=Naegleria lovaniensis TaxID=51637 RepID=A0AA88KH36_NAELO|nr:uncharacterized protein C9374_007319 [Naegleria lovaniensis]KAG2379180.1 hypothetical protein C9374_007319 [Naegleria lovaniensis]